MHWRCWLGDRNGVRPLKYPGPRVSETSHWGKRPDLENLRNICRLNKNGSGSNGADGAGGNVCVCVCVYTATIVGTNGVLGSDGQCGWWLGSLTREEHLWCVTAGLHTWRWTAHHCISTSDTGTYLSLSLSLSLCVCVSVSDLQGGQKLEATNILL